MTNFQFVYLKIGTMLLCLWYTESCRYIYNIYADIMYLLNYISDPEVHPQNEEYWGHVNPIGPRACYDEGKRVSETISYSYAKMVSIVLLEMYDFLLK